MGLYDRDYMGGGTGGNSPSGFGRGFGRGILGGGIFGGGATGALILANAVCFLFSAFLERLLRGRFVAEWLALSGDGLKHGAVWEFLSYAFLHEGLLHIFLNMLGLYFVGRILEQMIGSAKFLFVYFSGALAGGFFWILTAFGSNECLVGASAAVMSVFACFCAFYPPVPLTFLLFFVIPVRIKPLSLLKITAAVEVFGLLYSLAGGNISIAYAAHLGGLAAGVLAAYLIKRGKLDFASGFPLRNMFAFGNKKRKSASEYFYKVNIGESQKVPNSEIDRILDKISSSGFASLTDAERETLRRAREN